MNWTRATAWHEVSDCGRYTVCAAKVEDKYVFQGWRGSKPGELLCTGEAAECREVCEADALTRAQAAAVVDSTKEMK